MILEATLHRIPEQNFAGVQEKVQKLNRRAIKLGLAELQLKVVHEELVEAEKGTFHKYLHMQLIGEPPKIAGWTFVAALDHTEEGNIVRVLVDCELPEAYRTSSSSCDHCHHIRRRNSTYVLENEQHEFKQVGATCLKDFLGHDVSMALNRASLLASAADLLGAAGEYGGNKQRADYVELQRYLACVAATVRVRGWMSRQKALEKDSISTSHLALNVLQPSRITQTDDIRVEAGDEALATSAIALLQKHFDSKTELSDYEHNLKTILASEVVHYKALGFAASMIPFYQRLVDEAKPKEEKAVSDYFGVVGKRGQFELVLTKIVDLGDGPYGRNRILNFVDAAGNVAVWFTTNWLDTDTKEFLPGCTYKVVGSVKRQEEYRGVKQTTLTRCKTSCLNPEKWEAK